MRIKELDYLKGVMIILVITFHLVYFEHLYPYAKQVVYTFHMPVFLVISGYLMNISKKWGAFMLTIVGLVIPYLVMESSYTVMASLLPINEHIDHLTAGVFFDKLLLHPLGPYWYLHTLTDAFYTGGPCLLSVLTCIGCACIVVGYILPDWGHSAPKQYRFHAFLPTLTACCLGFYPTHHARPVSEPVDA